MQRKAARPEGTRRRSSHSSTGTSAIAITSAAVTGRKNSAPARSAKGKRQDQRRADHQRDRGEQPVAAEGGGLGLELEAFDRFLERLVLGAFVCHRGRQCPSPSAAEKR